ncbi:hypothetical protein [Nitrosophilus labii]|uniref:hypothetical protein n=1 Tax=Nitrosophilus labii TaxID=2706014 RepID=UPI0016569BD3|nr:hypothetical protein [Nitrosophilus labii]
MDERRDLIMLELDDFGKLKNINELKDSDIQNEKTLQEVEKFYQEKILDIEKNYQELLENSKKEFFQKGYVQGTKEKEEELNKKIEEIKKELIAQKESQLEDLSQNYKKIEHELSLKHQDYLNRLSSIILDNLGEVFEFLYIQNSNVENLKEAITQIILEFKESLPLEIKVSKKLYEKVKKSFTNIKVDVDDSLKEGDFIIEFYDFKLENSFKEKIEVLKDEIKREIKKFT